MKRRHFFGVAIAWPLAAYAQPVKLPTIGFLGAGSQTAWAAVASSFERRLSELGWIDGRTCTIIYRWADGKLDRYAEFAAEFVRLKVNVIVTAGSAVSAVMQATSTIPVVFGSAVDPLASGFVASLARPGGNITGLSLQSTDIAGKRVELLRQVIPGLARLAVLANVGYPAAARESSDVQAISLGAIALASWFYGREAQLYVYFTLSGVLLLIFGIDNWRHYVAWLAVAGACMLACLQLLPQSGFMPVTAGERDMLTIQAYSNTFAVMALVTFFALSNLRRQEVELEHQYARSAALMNTVFPNSIVQRLTSGEEDRIADRIEGLSVMFADLVGFTTASQDLPPEQIIDWLDVMVRRFDSLAAEHGVDKIKTIGDCYMAVGGLVGDPKQQAEALGRLAQVMIVTQAELPALGSKKLALRVGLHFGRATAGVIGATRFSYDVWGDAVNMASRLESHGIPGEIQVSDAFRTAAGTSFSYTERGVVEIRGIGPMRTWLLR